MQVDDILAEMDPMADMDMYIKSAMNSNATCQYGTALELLDWATEKRKPSEVLLSSQDGDSINHYTVVREGCNDDDIISPKVVDNNSIIEPISVLTWKTCDDELKKLVFDVCHLPEPERILSTVELVEMVKADTYSVREPFLQVSEIIIPSVIWFYLSCWSVCILNVFHLCL